MYASGVSSSSLQQGLSDELTIAYSASDGTPIWKGRYNDTGLDRDSAFDVAVTPDGRRVVTAATFFHSNVDGSDHGNIYDAGTAAYAEDAPTAVAVTAFAVHGHVVTWRTASENGLLGFTLRRDGRKLTRRLIPAKGGTGGASYRFGDRTAPRHGRHAYRLEAVGLDGTRVWSATARAR